MRQIKDMVSTPKVKNQIIFLISILGLLDKRNGSSKKDALTSTCLKASLIFSE
jgi:hypothetical protein